MQDHDLGRKNQDHDLCSNPGTRQVRGEQNRGEENGCRQGSWSLEKLQGPGLRVSCTISISYGAHYYYHTSKQGSLTVHFWLK